MRDKEHAMAEHACELLTYGCTCVYRRLISIWICCTIESSTQLNPQNEQVRNKSIRMKHTREYNCRISPSGYAESFLQHMLFTTCQLFSAHKEKPPLLSHATPPEVKRFCFVVAYMHASNIKWNIYLCRFGESHCLRL